MLSIKNNEYNCVRLSITAALYLVEKECIRESKYVSKLIDDYKIGEKGYEYITWLHDKYKHYKYIYIYIYNLSGNGKVKTW